VPFRARKQKGFSIIEVIVSMVFIALVSGFISIAFITSRMFVSLAKHKTQAVFIAQASLNTLRTGTYALLPVAGTYPSLLPNDVTIDTRNTTDPADDLHGTRDIILEGLPSDHYRKVTVTISWNENLLGVTPGTLKESAATFITDDPAAN